MKYTAQELQQMISDPEASIRPAPSPSTKPAMVYGAKCRAKCVGGNACIADAKHRHSLHHCATVGCLCHSRAYLDSKRKVIP